MDGPIPPWITLEDGLVPIHAQCPACNKEFSIHLILDTVVNPGHYARLDFNEYQYTVETYKKMYRRRWKKEAKKQAEREVSIEQQTENALRKMNPHHMGKC